MPVDQSDDAPRRHAEAHSSVRSSSEQAGPARRRVLVIGGSGTVGSAVVRALTTQGARVAVHSEGRAAEADQLVATLPGEGHLGVAADLSDGDAVAGLVRFVDAAFEGLDVVINAASDESAASPSILGSSLTEWTDAWTASLTFDVLGAATVAHAAANAFVERGMGGRIILLAARGRPFGQRRGSVTAATEECVAALGAALATELAPHGVSVTVIASGSAAAPGWSPDVLAETVAWLASGPSVVLPGAVVTIDG
ncbi:MAG: SDR family oxidoreductase [Actinomycetota bacterium]|nr:SDR family oxidoreductase [Actinomycetota bacterium]